MSPQVDRRAVAERIRTLIGGQDRGDVAVTADRLRVAVQALRRSIDAMSPHPSVNVMASIVREYGVDPTWLLYGRYDADTHAASLAKGTALTATDFIELTERRRHAAGNASDDSPHDGSANRR